MWYETLIPLYDAIGALGFLAAMGLGIRNYRRGGVERPFWLAFVATAGLGALWLTLVSVEWLGYSSQLLDEFSTSLQAVVIGLYAVGVLGTGVVVTDLRQSRQETAQRASLVAVLSRVLRHNIRNDMTVIRGYTALSDGGDRAQELVEAKIDDLIAMSEKARKIEQSLASGGRVHQVDALALIDDVVADAIEANPDAVISVDEDGVTDVCLPASLQSALVELVGNAITHGGDPPTVTIGLDVTEHMISIEVADDGTGLPEHEQRLLEDGIETPLIHGSGIGLWMARWVVRCHDGQISAAITDTGTTVTVQLPRTGSHLGSDTAGRTGLVRPGFDRYHAIFDNGADAHLVVGADRRLVDANGPAGTLFETTRRELLGRPLDAILASQAEVEQLWTTLEGEGTAHGMLTLRDGERVPYVAVANVVLGEHLVTIRAGGSSSPSA